LASSLFPIIYPSPIPHLAEDIEIDLQLTHGIPEYAPHPASPLFPTTSLSNAPLGPLRGRYRNRPTTDSWNPRRCSSHSQSPSPSFPQFQSSQLSQFGQGSRKTQKRPPRRPHLGRPYSRDDASDFPCTSQSSSCRSQLDARTFEHVLCVRHLASFDEPADMLWTSQALPRERGALS